nr:hypothetical protein RVX_1020 [Nitratidesulfovibrio sp. HK-II]
MGAFMRPRGNDGASPARAGLQVGLPAVTLERTTPGFVCTPYMAAS